MIPFASQRGNGQDLATHLQNEADNDHMEVAELRGAIAGDLHGAFAEWKLQADCLTRCQNYLYSLSINPWDKINGPMSRDQYADYIGRVEDRLGLSGQPRAIVYHIKNGREHAHVVWSRIDADNEKAIQMSFDHQTLMMVTREFARDHGLTLPDGYEKGREGKNKQNSLYEQHQQNNSGLPKEERMEQVTGAWRMSDNPQSFIKALSEMGYCLASGTRPYVLVDLYGHTNALPRMIDDKTVRAKDVQAFLEKDFPAESLPTVDEAKDLAARHREQVKHHQSLEEQAGRRERLKAAQEERRKPVELARDKLRIYQEHERQSLARKQASEKEALRQAFTVQEKLIAEKRERHKPAGLAAFLGRVTGMDMVRRKLHAYQDKKRFEAFWAEHESLEDTHRSQSVKQQRFHDMQSLEMDRKLRNLIKIEKREQASLKAEFEKEKNLALRAGHAHMPSFGPELSLPGRKANPERAKDHFRKVAGRAQEGEKTAPVKPKRSQDLTDAFDKAAGVNNDSGTREDGDARGMNPPDLTNVFDRAAGVNDDSGERDEDGETRGIMPPDLTDTFDKAAGVEEDSGDDGHGGDADGRKPGTEPGQQPRRPGRNRRRNRGRDR